jgi:hypothetical protein
VVVVAPPGPVVVTWYPVTGVGEVGTVHDSVTGPPVLEELAAATSKVAARFVTPEGTRPAMGLWSIGVVRPV